ncbi:hypothetical protein GPALN_010133 [Globodera pallida]|nr:hypothetical protein GPALN_010133 [Globodera pallida]
MSSQSPTPKSERRHHVRSLSQPKASRDGINNSNNNSNNGQDHRIGQATRAASLYHQICAVDEQHRMASSANNGPLMNCPWPVPAMESMTSHQQMTAAKYYGGCASELNTAAEHQAVLIYKMQLLHCVEVATKRLLFHLVKTSASMPNLFRALPFFLFVLSFLCFFAFSPRSAAISFHLLTDSFHFGGSASTSDSNCPCVFVRSANVGRNQFAEDNPAYDAPEKQSAAEFVIIMSIRNNQQFDSLLPPANRTALAFWYDMCRQCRMDSVVEHLLNNNLEWTFPEAIERDEFDAQHAMKSPQNRTTPTEKSRIFVAGTIGDVEMDSASSGKHIRRAHSLLLRVKLKPQLKLPILTAFERRLRRIVEDELEVHMFSAQRWAEEVEHAFRAVHLKMVGSVSLLMSIMAFMGTKRDAYESRPTLGLHIALVLALCILSVYIVHIAGTGHLNPLLFPVPYVLISIGSLCFSTINACLDRYSGIAMHPTEKMAFIFIWDGPCLMHSLIFLAVLCVVMALFITNSLLVQSLLAFAVGFVCLLLFTLFLTVCWLNYAQRVASGLKWFQFCRRGDRAYNEKQMFDYDSRTCARLHEKLADLRPSFARRIGALACSQHYRMVVFALFTVACFAATVWSSPTAELGMAHFVPPGDGIGSTHAFLDRYRMAFPKYENYLEFVFEGPLDYEERKEQIFALLRWPLEAGLAIKAVSWLAEFDKFQKNVEYRIDEDSILPLLTHAFLAAKQFHKFASDVHISQGQIHRSRMYLELSEEGRRNNEYLMREILARARHAGLPLVLKAPFSFNPVHDLWVLNNLNSALIALSVLSALLNILQPATAVCLLLTNMFLWTTVRTIGQQFLQIPLNIVTLGTLLFGILFNSASVLHFAYHFFNAGLRQRESIQRVQYAFQCTFWPILLAAITGPVCFSVQLLLEQYPPVVFHVWKMLTLCSAVTLLQTITVLPGLLILFADYFHFVFTYANQLCDDNANAALTVDPMADNVYFVPNSYSCATTADRARFGGQMIYPIDHHPYSFHSPTCLPPAYFPPPIEFQCRSVAQQAVQQHNHHRLHSNSGSRSGQHQQQGSYSPGRLSVSATTTTAYNSPSPNHQRRRRQINESESGGKRASVVGNSRNESMESCRLSDHHQNHRLHRCTSHHSSPQVPSALHQHLHQRNLLPLTTSPPRFVAQQPPPRDGTKKTKEEQIYEEPDSPPEMAKPKSVFPTCEEGPIMFANSKAETATTKR